MPKLDFSIDKIENKDNKVTSVVGIDENTTDDQYPSAKAVHDLVNRQADYVLERGETTTAGFRWRYMKWASGFVECWLYPYFYPDEAASGFDTALGQGLYATDDFVIQYPFIFENYPYEAFSISGTAYKDSRPTAAFVSMGTPHFNVINAGYDYSTFWFNTLNSTDVVGTIKPRVTGYIAGYIK